MELLLPETGLIFITVFGLATIILWLIAMIDILRSEFRGQNDKLIWVLIVLFAPFIGAILYVIIGRKNKVNYS